ncbi:MAG: ABC transporter ATP-binding protein [Acidimicrobiia bacterium]
MTALSIEDISIGFGGVDALSEINIVVKAGERRAVVGPNGAGKSTLFNVVGGQLRPDTGAVVLLGQEVTREPPLQRAQRGLARTWQITNLFDPLSVYETVQLAVAATKKTRRVYWRALDSFVEVSTAAEAILKEWELWEHRNRPVQDLAYGQQRLLEIVVSLAANPKVLLLDEPTAGLTPAEAERMTTIVGDLPRTITVVMIEHDMSVAFALADQMTVLYQGRVLAQGPTDEVRQRDEVIEAYLGVRDA